ncbi:MAG TPA: hypothetical protein VFZ37_04825 [Jiangellaceae bacterium]
MLDKGAQDLFNQASGAKMDHAVGRRQVDGDTTLSGRVLLVGKRQRVLDEVAAGLRRLGLYVHEETDVAQAAALDGANYEVLAIGRAISSSKRSELISRLRKVNPRLKVVEGLAPITPLLVAQVEEALTSPGPDASVVGKATLETVNSRVVLTLRRPCETQVVLHRLDMFYRAHEIEVHHGPLVRGKNFLPVGGRITHGERFLVVRAKGETTVHPAS